MAESITKPVSSVLLPALRHRIHLRIRLAEGRYELRTCIRRIRDAKHSHNVQHITALLLAIGHIFQAGDPVFFHGGAAWFPQNPVYLAQRNQAVLRLCLFPDYLIDGAGQPHGIKYLVINRPLLPVFAQVVTETNPQVVEPRQQPCTKAVVRRYGILITEIVKRLPVNIIQALLFRSGAVSQA